MAAALGWGAAAGAAPLALTEVAPGVFVHRGADEDFTPENGGGIIGTTRLFVRVGRAGGRCSCGSPLAAEPRPAGIASAHSARASA
jgi:hypothetical protein